MLIFVSHRKINLQLAGLDWLTQIAVCQELYRQKHSGDSHCPVNP